MGWVRIGGGERGRLVEAVYTSGSGADFGVLDTVGCGSGRPRIEMIRGNTTTGVPVVLDVRNLDMPVDAGDGNAGLYRRDRAGRRHPHRRRRVVVQALGVVVVAAAAGVGVWAGIGQPPPAVSQPAVPAALAGLLQQVHLTGRIRPVAGYERGCGMNKTARAKEGCVFGPAWNDPGDHSGCDTRSRLLAASLKGVEFKPGTHECKPVAGVLDPDPYTGQVVDLKHVEVDHIYPLRRSWDAGAWKWTSVQRQSFANDLAELIAVSDRANRAKSDAGLDEWLPRYRPCDYIQRYVSVAVKYRLPITTAERSAAANTCRITQAARPGALPGETITSMGELIGHSMLHVRSAVPAAMAAAGATVAGITAGYAAELLTHHTAGDTGRTAPSPTTTTDPAAACQHDAAGGGLPASGEMPVASGGVSR